MCKRQIISLLLLFSFQSLHADTFKEFIEKLTASPLAERRALVDSFVNVPDSNFPVTEDTLAFFIYRGNVTSSITVAGDFNGWNPSQDTLLNIEGTNFYYLTKTFETDARLDYKYVKNGSNWILDPLNPNRVSGGYGANSELAMPGYIQPVEIQYFPDIPHGRIESFNFSSQILQNQRKVYIYLPPGYEDNPTSRYPVLYVNDGGEYKNLAAIINVTDYLIYQKDIPGIILVLVDPVDRNVEYIFNTNYQNMIISELLPYIDLNYRTHNAPSQRGIMGTSLGGLVSLDISWRHPEVFGFCAGQSGAFWLNNEQIIQTVNDGPKKDIRFYLDWGTYETSIRESNYSLRDVLLAKGNRLVFFEFHEGHSWGNWRAHIDNILKAFLDTETVIESRNFLPPVNTTTLQNYPNPFNASTSILYSVSSPGLVQIEIYDELGRLINTIENRQTTPGEYFIFWDGRDMHNRPVGSGIYFCTLKLNGRIKNTRQIILIK